MYVLPKSVIFMCALVVTLAATSCTQSYREATGYKASGSYEFGHAFGYSDKKIGEDEYSITAIGNPATDKQRVLERFPIRLHIRRF